MTESVSCFVDDDLIVWFRLDSITKLLNLKKDILLLNKDIDCRTDIKNIHSLGVFCDEDDNECDIIHELVLFKIIDLFASLNKSSTYSIKLKRWVMFALLPALKKFGNHHHEYEIHVFTNKHKLIEVLETVVTYNGDSTDDDEKKVK